MYKFLPILLFAYGLAVTEAENVDLNYYYINISNLTTINEKRLTIIEVESIADEIVLFFQDDSHLKVQHIVSIETDSIEIELLNFQQFQWKKQSPSLIYAGQISKANKDKPSYIKKIAIQDIMKIRIQEKMSPSKLIFTNLFYISMIVLFYYMLP